MSTMNRLGHWICKVTRIACGTYTYSKYIFLLSYCAVTALLVAVSISIITSDDIICPCSETLYSPEELLGMLLHQAREFAQDSAGQPINEAVLTVPGFFNQAERRALLKAAELAGLKVLQLMNDYTAGKFSIQYLRLLQCDTACDLSGQVVFLKLCWSFKIRNPWRYCMYCVKRLTHQTEFLLSTLLKMLFLTNNFQTIEAICIILTVGACH